MESIVKVQIGKKFLADIPASMKDAFVNKNGGRKMAAYLINCARDQFSINLKTVDMAEFEKILINHFYISRSEWVRDMIRKNIISL